MIVDELVVRITLDTERLRRDVEQARRYIEGLAGSVVPPSGRVVYVESPLASIPSLLARQLAVMEQIEQNTRALLRDPVEHGDEAAVKGVLAYGRRGESAGLSYEVSL